MTDTFKDYMGDFQSDTGLNAKDNLPLYMKYYHAKMTERFLSDIEHTLVEICIHLKKIGSSIEKDASGGPPGGP